MLGGKIHISEGFLYALLQFLGSGYESHFFQFFYDLSGFLTVLQVISVAGTVLGILFGASYFSKNQTSNIVDFSNIGKHSIGYIAKFCNLINDNITYARTLFWFSLIIFCTAFAYVMVLGVNNLLRYYYNQKLEDRLHELISYTTDDKKEGPLLHWNAYIALL